MNFEPPVDRNEAVADSEGEGEEMSMTNAFGKRLVSSVSAFTTTNMDPSSRGVSSISEFPAGPSRRKLDDISPGSAHERRKDFISPNDGEDTSFEGTMSIADRAKTRQRTQTKRKAPEISANIIELTSEEDEPIPKISGSKSKFKPQAQTTKLNNKEATNTAYEAKRDTGNEAKQKPKPRPRPINKRQRTDTETAIPPHEYPFGKRPYLDGLVVLQPPPTPPPASSQSRGAELPIATSPPRAMYSQLPPSDPPNPTMTSAYEGDGGCQPLGAGLPPIETLQDAESDHDERASSPSSLFSEKGHRKTRTCRERPSYNMEIDELASSPADVYKAPPRRDPSITRQVSPPPTFFAGFSSLGLPRTSPVAATLRLPDVVDLTDLPPTIAPVLDKSKLKAKKPKKKAALYDEEFEPNAAPMMVLDEDDKDDDFDPSGEGGGGKKVKGKGKQKEKKPKGKKQTGKKKVQVEVVIPTKGKQKVAKDLEVFKSSEFVNDSDEDNADPLRLVGGKEGLTEGMPDDSSSTIHVRPPGLSVEKPDKDPSQPTAPSKKPSKGGAKSKKPPPTPEADEEISGAEAEEAAPVKKPRKSRKKATPAEENDQTTVQEPDLDASTETTPQVKISKEKASSKRKAKIIPSEDEGDEGATIGKPVVPEPMSSLEKENNSPPTPLKHITSTPRPFSSRASSIRPDGTTPLYSRYEVAPRRGSLSMTELIRRASLKPCSPFPTTVSTPSLKDKSKSKPTRTDPDPVGSPAPLHSTYSPYLKSSRRLLSRIAPLHPNRKTPPPPPPPPPPRKKTKKELEMEEKWEEELVDQVGGIETFAAMEESERKELRRVKREKEMCGYDD